MSRPILGSLRGTDHFILGEDWVIDACLSGAWWTNPTEANTYPRLSLNAAECRHPRMSIRHRGVHGFG